MFIRIQDLQKQEITLDEQLRPGTLDLGPDVQQIAPVKVKGRAELIEEHEGDTRISDIRLRGDYTTRVAMQCARCIEPIERNLSGSFDLIYRPLGATTHPPESSISEAESEIGFYQGDGLQLEQAMVEQVLLAVPIRELCRADCKGICPRCGQNLNDATCQCTPEKEDSRWAGLRNIREQLNR